jgi:hypothetical protein
VDEAKLAAWKGCYVCEQCGTRDHYGEMFLLYAFCLKLNFCSEECAAFWLGVHSRSFKKPSEKT